GCSRVAPSAWGTALPRAGPCSCTSGPRGAYPAATRPLPSRRPGDGTRPASPSSGLTSRRPTPRRRVPARIRRHVPSRGQARGHAERAAFAHASFSVTFPGVVRCIEQRTRLKARGQRARREDLVGKVQRVPALTHLVESWLDRGATNCA